MPALSKPTLSGFDYPTRIGALFDAFNNGNYNFPATQVPSADANTLDDYEEGTWTPSLGGTATYLSQIGVYTKIGRAVLIVCEVNVNVLGTGSTTTITGLPFTCGVQVGGGVTYFSALAVAVAYLTARANGTSLFFASTAAAATGVTNVPAIFGNGADVIFELFYNV